MKAWTKKDNQKQAPNKPSNMSNTAPNKNKKYSPKKNAPQQRQEDPVAVCYVEAFKNVLFDFGRRYQACNKNAEELELAENSIFRKECRGNYFQPADFLPEEKVESMQQALQTINGYVARPLVNSVRWNKEDGSFAGCEFGYVVIDLNDNDIKYYISCYLTSRFSGTVAVTPISVKYGPDTRNRVQRNINPEKI